MTFSSSVTCDNTEASSHGQTVSAQPLKQQSDVKFNTTVDLVTPVPSLMLPVCQILAFDGFIFHIATFKHPDTPTQTLTSQEQGERRFTTMVMTLTVLDDYLVEV